MRRERFTGIGVIVLGIVVAVVAILALRDPGHDSASPDPDTSTPSVTSTRTGTATGTPAPTRRSSAPRTSAPGTPASSTPAPGSSSTTGAKSIPLVVLNNTTTSGLAADAAKRFESGGWTVTTSGNLTNNIISTCAYYDPDVAGAKAAAEALRAQYPTIKRVEPKFAELPAGPVVVVLTSDYSAS